MSTKRIAVQMLIIAVLAVATEGVMPAPGSAAQGAAYGTPLASKANTCATAVLERIAEDPLFRIPRPDSKPNREFPKLAGTAHAIWDDLPCSHEDFTDWPNIGMPCCCNNSHTAR